MYPTDRDNCLPADFTRSIPTRNPAQAHEVPLIRLKGNPYQPRSRDVNEDLDELVESVRQYGILQPILIRKITPNEYEIIAGERRRAAAHRAGLKSIPAIICDVTDHESALIALIENLQRKNLSPVETARGFRTLMQKFGLSQREIGERVGKTQSGVARVLRLLSLPEEILNSLHRGDIQEGHARVLLRADTLEAQLDRWRQMIADKLSVRQAEQRFAESADGETQAAPTNEEAAPSLFDGSRLKGLNETALQELLSQKFSVRVMIRSDARRQGRVEIGFYDYDALLTLTARLLNAPA